MKGIQQKGITLIALVITIIILMILAGITISTLTGKNGLLDNAKKTETQTKIESIKEQIKIDILDEQTKNEGNISDDILLNILLKYGTLSDEEKIIDRTLTTKEKYKIKVSDIFNGTTVNEEKKIVANEPDISGFNKNNTYYVTWNLENSPYTINENTSINEKAPSDWYDYKTGENRWANIKTTGGENDCYWVWIPRYAYKVPSKGDNNNNTAQKIEIKFLKEKSNIPIGETEEINNTTPTPGTWVVHPAFTNAGNGGFGELTGIWVAKYQASSSKVNKINLQNGKLTGDTDSLSSEEYRRRSKYKFKYNNKTKCNELERNKRKWYI